MFSIIRICIVYDEYDIYIYIYIYLYIYRIHTIFELVSYTGSIGFSLRENIKIIVYFSSILNIFNV